MKRIINLGCGNETYGDVRVDFQKTETTTHVCDLNNVLPFEDNSFDEVYCRSVLEHIKDLGIFTDECFRVLKKGGKIWIRTDYAGYIIGYLSKKYDHNEFLNYIYKTAGGKQYGHKKGEDAHYHLFVESHLRKLFKKFNNLKFNYYKRPLRNWYDIKGMILRILPFKFGAMHVEMWGEK